MLEVFFACGIRGAVSPNTLAQPRCGHYPSHQIVRVTAPPPSIRGVCSGPIVTTELLEPIAVNLCAKGAKPLPVPLDPRQDQKPRSLRKDRHAE